MKNIEKYENEISQLVNEVNSIECSIATVAGIPCFAQACKECRKKCIDWMYTEYKEQILSDDEKVIVKAMCDIIHEFECTVIDVKKIDVGNCKCFISIRYGNYIIGTDDTISSPIIDNDEFKGMELNRKYTLEELGLENVNG